MSAKVVAQRYELREILGEGGMGVVYRAMDTRTNCLVAIKTLKNASDPETLAMFGKEWRELAQITHPNIVGVRDVGDFKENGETIPFFVMPLLQGCTLAALIHESSPRLTVENVVEIICQVCRGLNAAHEKELIHRDLKPSNIFVMRDGTAQIIDFGLVQSSTAKTEAAIKGTLQYMAPEQTEGKKVTRASDVFSLGVVAYEALTGKQPFLRRDKADTAQAVKQFSPPPASEVNPKVGELVSKAIHKAMAKQPIHRYTSAREFADTLQKAIHNLPIDGFDLARIQPKIARAKEAFERGDCEFASELLMELEAEGNVDPQITLLRAQVEESTRQKRIRNLFEATQTRLEQNEIPLAIAKLSEILTLDRDNAQALSMMKAIDQRRIKQQLSGWMKRATDHMARNDFSEARLALSEVFKIQYDEPEGLRLRSEIEAREKDAANALREKEKLYSVALKASERGELSSAISSLEKLIELNRTVPGSAIPERDKVYQAFYANMVSERASLDNAYEEASRHLTEKNFEKSLQACDRILTKYPANAQFKALRIKIQDSQGLFLSAYIAEVGKAVESEASLDRRVAILEEANKKFPNEQQFTRQLTLAREHRDLVASILAKARAYEEQEQFGEAIQQWKILASTHPLYVGAESEISQLEVRRDRQYNEEKKTRWVQRVDQALDNWAFAEALRFATEALYDFPNDSELLSQEAIAKQGLDRLLNAERSFDEAKTLRAGGEIAQAVECLKNALQLNERHFAARSMLINLLGEQANAELDSDIAKAEALARTATALDPEHPSVKRITAVIAEKRRSESVAAAISRARGLLNSNPNGARAIIDGALQEHPGDGRLLQFKANLVGPQKSRQATAPEANNDRTRLYDSIISDERSMNLDRTVGPAAESKFASQTVTVLSGPEKHLAEFPGTAAVAAGPRTPDDETPSAKPAKPSIDKRSLLAQLAGSFRNWSGGNSTAALFKKSPARLWTIAGICLAILAAAVIAIRPKPPKPHKIEPSVKLVSVDVSIEPADAQLRVDQTLYPERTLSLRNDKSHSVSVTRVGFHPVETEKKTGDVWKFKLTPEPIHLDVSTNAIAGEVLLDGRKMGDLDRGSFSDSSIVPDGGKHTLRVTNETGDIFRISFQGNAGTRPTVEPLATKDLTVTSSLGNQATVYSGSRTRLTLPDGQPPRIVDQNGLDLDLEGLRMNAPGADVEGKIARGNRTEDFFIKAGNAPVLEIASNAGVATQGTFVINTPTKNASLTLDGNQRKAEQPGLWRLTAAPGEHEIKLSAAGMNDQDLKISVLKGSRISRKIVMTAAPKLATLVIKNGMSGTTITLDHSKFIGVINAAGTFSYDKIPAGEHEITLDLAGHGSLTSRQAFKEGQILDLPGNVRLNKLEGHVTITVSPSNGTVEYRQSGDNEWHTAQLPTASLAPGNYDFAATAPGFKRVQRNVVVEGSSTGRVDFVLEKELTPIVPSTSLVQGLTPKEGWYFSDKGEWVSVVAGTQKCTIIFLRPDRYVGPGWRPKHFEWMVSVDSNRVSYSVNGHSLNRKGKTSTGNDSASNEVAPADNLIYSFVVVLDTHGVQIKNKDGAVIDNFKSEGVDWTRGRISIKGNAFFDVRR